MKTRNKLFLIGIMISINFLSSFAQGSIQVYESDSGKIKLDLPMTLSSESGCNSLDLTLPGSVKPIIAIRLQEPFGEDLEKYASSSGFQENRIEMMTDDGHRILSFLDPGSVEERYTVFIDYLNEKNKIAQMWTYSEVHAKGETLATFDRNEFHKIAESFAFINDTEFQAIKAEESKNTPGFGTILAITSIFGIICAFRKLNKF